MLTPVRVLSAQGPMRVELARWRGQLVVVKRLQSVSPVLAARLEREAEVVHRLDHPNIVPLLGSHDGALIYSYCPGVSVAEALEEGSLSLGRSLRVAHDVLSALEYAHSQGVIHFDVKPANILVKGERCLLTDFGFAKDLGLTNITGEQTMLGTPSYMAPEQFQGVRTDRRSDIYAVGAVLYHMLSGSPPFGGQVLRFLVGDETVKLAPLPQLPGGLHEVVHKALQRDPDSRFPTAEAMLAALQPVPS
ncbi:MAG: serine/threonine-protein kinase [Trueperaceae bacterium]